MTLPTMLRRLFQILGGVLGLGLAGCDDGAVITRVWTSAVTADYLRLSGGDGFPVEVHGAPFPGITPQEVVARLRAPSALRTGIRFRAVEPGTLRDGARMMLVFNRTDPPDGRTDCRRGGPAQKPGTGGDAGFTVTMTFCNGVAMEATGHMEARKVRADDPEAFARVMQQLMLLVTERPA